MASKVDQLSFEGMPVRGVTFAMKSITDLGGKEELHVDEFVGGEWSGQVVSVHHDRDKDGNLIRKHLVSVEKATIASYKLNRTVHATINRPNKKRS